MSLKSGRYILTHAQHWNLAFLPDANDATSLLGCLEQDVPGEQWNVKDLRNGRYSIVNFAHKMSASAGFYDRKGDHVIGRETGCVWLIKEYLAGGTYTIATADDRLRWWLDSSWVATPITLHDAPPSDLRCQWNFQRIGHVNTTPDEAVKEEAAVIKAELSRAKEEVIRTLADLQAARREAAEAKATAAEDAARWAAEVEETRQKASQSNAQLVRKWEVAKKEAEDARREAAQAKLELARKLAELEVARREAAAAKAVAAPPESGLGDPINVEEILAELNTYVADTGLEKYFPPESRFLQSIAEKAAKLREDPTTDLGKPENVKRLTCLSLYQPIIYCDDSGSMAGENRFASQRELITRIACIATKIVPDNLVVYLRFINANSTFGKSANQIEAEYDAHQPGGGTPIGISLRQKILQPLVYDVFARGGRLERPLLICAITDGSPGDGDTFKDEIVKCRQKLLETGYESTAVRFCISQIGNDRAATRFLDGLRSDLTIQDVLYCTTDRLDDAFRRLRANERELDVWLLDTLTRPIMSRYSD